MTCRWATLHWLRVAAIQTPDTMDLAHQPRGAASWRIGPDLNLDRVIDFRHNIDQVRAAMRIADGNVAVQVFTPHTYGDDGFTTAVGPDETAMASAAYRPGAHRSRIDRHQG